MKKWVLFLVLALTLTLPLPVLGAETAPAKTYEQAVAELREKSCYSDETVYETDLCSVFSYSISGTSHGTWGHLDLVYKAGSPLGEGTVVSLPLHEKGDWRVTLAPDAVELNEDGSGLRYTYYSPELGTDVYSVDLVTAEITASHIPATYEEIFAANTLGWNVERQLETPNCTVVLMWTDLTGVPEPEHVRDYVLALISKESVEPEKQFLGLLLPSTVAVKGEFAFQYPTDRAPDEMFLNEDGSVLTYVYSFEEALFNDRGDLLHEAGTYTYRVDTATGELNVSHEAESSPSSPALGAEGTTFVDIAPGDWFAPYVEVCAQEGLMRGTGEGAFSPYGTLSEYESTVLALRLHDLGQDGDGSFEKAPWDWGYAFLTLPDGTVREGYLGDGSSWDWTRLGRADDGHFGFRLDTEEEQEWGRSMDYQRAALTLNGKEYAGDLHLNGSGFLYFDLSGNWDDDEEYREGYYAIQGARSAPSPNVWWRDAWYYAEENGLEDLLNRGSGRRIFALQMAAVTDLPAINEIPGLPDTGDSDILELYRAGVLTGSDEYGTFGDLPLTRAEAAAICARILRPELRVSFSPKPLETYENYTLTYLRKDGERPGGPYCPMHSMDLVVPDHHSLLRLDGAELTVPEGYTVETVGDGVAGLIDLAYEGEGQAEDRFGLLDSQGRFRACTRDQVFAMSRYPYDNGEFHNGYRYQGAFFNEKGEQASQAFDWAGVIDTQGAGFVGLDGNIYRIQFEK